MKLKLKDVMKIALNIYLINNVRYKQKIFQNNLHSVKFLIKIFHRIRYLYIFNIKKVFETSNVTELLQSSLDGYSATVFAYG